LWSEEAAGELGPWLASASQIGLPCPALPRVGFALTPTQPLQNMPPPFIPRARGLLLTLLRDLVDGAPNTGKTTICSGVNSDFKHYVE